MENPEPSSKIDLTINPEIIPDRNLNRTIWLTVLVLLVCTCIMLSAIAVVGALMLAFGS